MKLNRKMEPNRAAGTTKAKFWKPLLSGSMICLSPCAFYWVFTTFVNYIHLFNHDPKSTVFVDGRSVQFSDGPTGVAELYPWKWSFEVVVVRDNQRTRRIVYPRAEKSDSGSITVRRDGTIAWNLETGHGE